ncbi:hypothetical protein [Acidovorax sp. NB1]|uniref:glycine-rich domain-containing protein n=1 Tax=Acidovorax sp. NB1 TaxID=1943571 RepID=UPI0010D91D57|nr:hypothetical protein [Acidovorax sp. NB1]GDY37677.1 hypothetical protein ACINB_35690 [Acidovorax sp. NB1]
MNYDQAFGGAGAASAKRLTTLVLVTRSFTVPAWATKVTVPFHASGGSGAWANTASTASATGGNSGPWGQVTIDVEAGKTLTVNLGAGGVQPAANNNGNQGSSSTLVYDGLTVMTLQGGEGGIYAASGLVNPATPAATVTGADFWVPGLPAWQANNSASGGAASNIFNLLSSELTMTPQQAGRSVGARSNTPATTPLMGLIHQSIPMLFFSTTVGHPGVGGDGSGVVGLFAGGFGNQGTGAGTTGGQGGGGGGGVRVAASINNAGGAALAYVVFSE